MIVSLTGHQQHSLNMADHKCTIAASPGAGYGAPELNLDEKQICVDVSTFLPVEWSQDQGEQCTTDFVQKCEERSENVCGEVTETLCEVSDDK